jgi:hypothetical protein
LDHSYRAVALVLQRLIHGQESSRRCREGPARGQLE